ncbi:uncharacterized protein LOC129303230 [Prosopis cineraria]|uniref:uncharacterized protein LOC129303230 n=1 Tax=Prosopis cineraria TaxID=364024 RepID=UPI00240EB43E|nr:uncharacterized protein LOC129303230 [Prosopis cineraria]
MEHRNFLRFFFLLFFGALALLVTWLHFPPLSNTKLVHCNLSSQRCFFRPELLTFLKKPPSPTRRHHHEPTLPATLSTPSPSMNSTKSVQSSPDILSSNTPLTLSLHRPPRTPQKLVKQWKSGDPLFPRKASVIARVNAVSNLVLTVDLSTQQVTRHEVGPVFRLPHYDCGGHGRSDKRAAEEPRVQPYDQGVGSTWRTWPACRSRRGGTGR